MEDDPKRQAIDFIPFLDIAATAVAWFLSQTFQ